MVFPTVSDCFVGATFRILGSDYSQDMPLDSKLGLDRKLGAGGHILTRRESNLFDFSKVVFCILVQGESAKRPEWDFFLRPNLGQVEDIPAELFSLFRAEDL